MGKSDQNQAKGIAKSQIDINQQNEAAANTQLQSVFNKAQDTAGSILPGITSGYSEIAQTGGGISQPATDAYSKLASGGSVSEDLVNYGGISPEQTQAIRSNAAESARSSYLNASDDARRKFAATGGYGNIGAIEQSLARQGSEAAAKAAIQGDATVAGLQQSGRLQATNLQQSGIAQGASGLAQQQQQLTGNKLQALQGSTNIYGMNEQQVTATVDQILRNYQQTGQMNAQDLAILTNLANQPGVFDKIVGTIGTLGGAAAGVIGALKP